MEPVEIRFTITREEYTRAMRRYYKTKLRIKRDLIAGVAMMIAGVCLIWTMDSVASAWLLLVAGGFLLIIVMYAMLILPHIIYRSQPKLKSEYRIQFREDVIIFQTNEINAELKWSIYHSWSCDNEFYILYHGKRDISVIPRRVLSESSDSRLEKLLLQNVGSAIVR